MDTRYFLIWTFVKLVWPNRYKDLLVEGELLKGVLEVEGDKYLLEPAPAVVGIKKPDWIKSAQKIQINIAVSEL